MAISNQTVIQRMVNELQSLQEETPSKAELLRHIGNVKLMCELMLENEEGLCEEKEVTTKQPHASISDEKMIDMLQKTPAISEEEYNVMIKGSNASEKEGHGAQEKSNKERAAKQGRTNHNDANGDSIFDF